MELCIRKICEDIDKYQSSSILPRDISQLIFSHLVDSCSLSDNCIEEFRDCALHAKSLICAWENVRDLLWNCSNLQALGLDCCDKISAHGIKHVGGFTNLTYLGFRKCCGPSAEAMKTLSGLMKLVKLEFERCPLIHGGLVHLEGLTNLESLTIRSCKWLVNFKELQISCNDITNVGVSYLRDLDKLVVLNLEGFDVTASCLVYLTAFTSLKSLNLNRCRQIDDGCEKFSAQQFE
ncbi:hypothetical protein K7X08_028191 [Anisodus acutangulus]|uniref:Uncharacterized protein n=1 Tax=Anisodus acutangulus TaxID=402998 RepID=A0A9Q1MUN0_9SOLA|nr:hypothetical protein K7X08_028191 [Anisodus acutangulus]